MSASLANHLLIAMPAMDDPNFHRAVALICQHDDQGAMGLIINRGADFTLGDLLKQLDIVTHDLALGETGVVAGGPVQPERGFVLHDDTREWNSTLRLGEGRSITTSRDILDAMARGDGPAQSLVALGYAGWGAGQLEAELAQNSWLTVPADDAILFHTPLAERWQAATRGLGFDPGQLSDYAGHA